MRKIRFHLGGSLAVGTALFLAATSLLVAQDADKDREPAPKTSAPGPLDVALDKRITGKASLADVRVDAAYIENARLATARVYGNGVVICGGKLQLTVKKPVVLTILKDVRKSSFASWPDHFGETEGEEDEGPRLKGRIDVRAGTISKSVLQLVDGEQSEELEELSRKILTVCRDAAQKGTGAESIADGLRKLGQGALAPEVLEVTVQRRPKASASNAAEPGWILTMEGRRVTDRLMPPGTAAPPPRLLVLSDADFQAVVALLADQHAGEIPINVFATDYTDLRLSLLKRSRTITGRAFLKMTPETHGEKQKEFDRVYAGFQALHERAQKEGTAIKTPPPAPKKSSESEEEREREEREREREKEREREQRKPTPIPAPSSPVQTPARSR